MNNGVSFNVLAPAGMAVLKWVHKTGFDWHYIQPRKPVQSVSIGNSNGRVIGRCLNESWFFWFRDFYELSQET